MNEFIVPLLIAAVIIFVIFRQFKARKVKRLQFFLLPVIAFYELLQSMPHPLSGKSVAELLVTVLLAAVIGVAQAYTTRLEYRGGELYTKGGLGYFLCWIVLLACRLLVRWVFEGAYGFTHFSEGNWLIFAGIGIAWAVRSFLLYRLHPEIRSALSRAKEQTERG
ncbi:CcdC protein domain-containing protein [Paenibacillus physcomitrellae]|uniref:DUF1453 family protein n=1 Tax=Paenibacillus physcomitrellae TaxID=1619311 RepID=A0ABQ1FY54_9BACL|nr:CcdC protein domain-containing protein [Paenibacillus physcomitrellae]GGA33739.1 hypothetical protein GCM10010917_18720 [Paenibacillus physcomitrellae]